MESSLAIAQAKYWHLKQVVLFAGLASNDVREFGEYFDTELIETGRRVYEFGDMADRVYVVKSGKIKITRTSDGGKEFILYFIRPGEVFGELAITGQERRSGSATVIDDAFVCTVGRQDFERFMLQHPAVSLEIAKIIGRRKERTEGRMLDLVTKDVRTRLARTLAELAAEFGRPDKSKTLIDLRLTQTELAQLVGSTRETTSTVFNEFRRNGLVDSEGKRIWVLDSEALGKYAWAPGVCSSRAA